MLDPNEFEGICFRCLLQAPTAALLQQSSIVTDPAKSGVAVPECYTSAQLLHKSRIRLMDGRPYSPTASPEVGSPTLNRAYCFEDPTQSWIMFQIMVGKIISR